MKSTNLIYSFILLTFLLTYGSQSLTAQIRARHHLTSKAYQDYYNQMDGAGYQLQCVTGYTLNGVPRFAGIWKKQSGAKPIAQHNLNSSEYQAAFDSYTKKGYRLKMLSGYEVGNRAHFAAIWEKNNGKVWAAAHNMTASQYQKKFDDMVKLKYYPTYVTAYEVRGQAYFAAIWEKSPRATVAKHGMTASQYNQEVQNLGSKGFFVQNVCGYRIGNQDYFIALWEKKRQPMTYARHGLNATNYQQAYDNVYYQGYTPVYVSAYTVGGSARFNAIWHNSRMSADDMGVLDKAVTNYLSTQHITNISYAVTKNGKLVFAKSHGYANSNSGIEMSPKTALRIMSVSKGITGAAIMRLLEQKRLSSLNARVFGNNSIFGNQYAIPEKNKWLKDITVSQLLHHVSGLNTCNGEAEFYNKSKNYNDVMTMLVNKTGLFDSSPGTKSLYSNTGFFFLGAIIEKLSGRSYEDYVRREILNKAEVGATMYVGNADGTSKSGEATYAPATLPNLQLFGPFGGWVARPMDLLRYLTGVDGEIWQQDVFARRATHDSLVATVTHSGNYGCGWIVNGSSQSHNGGFHGTRSWLAEIGNGLAIAVITNEEPDADPNGHPIMLNMLTDAVRKVKAFPNYDLYD